MTKRLRKAVFPVAGLGTHFLPAAKSIPKEMLTIVDRPVLQHMVDCYSARSLDAYRRGKFLMQLTRDGSQGRAD